MQLSPRGRIVLALTASVLLFAAGFALASPKLLVGIESAVVRSGTPTIVYTSNEPADFTCAVGRSRTSCGKNTTAGSTTITDPLAPGTYTFAVTALNSDPDTPTVTFSSATSTIFTVASTVPPAPPPAPPPGRPDLAVKMETHGQHQHVTADVVVTNVGQLAAPPTHAHLEVAQYRSRARRVPGLRPGQHYNLHLVMATPASLSNQTRQLAAVLTPVPGETDVENNRDSQPATFPPTPAPPPAPAPPPRQSEGGTSWWPIGGAIAGATLLIGGIFLFVQRGRLTPTQKLDWQLEATEGELPEHCAVGKRICKRETKLTPKPRQLTELTCARDPSSGRALAIKGKAVEHLTDAHAAYIERHQEEAESLVAAAEARVWHEMSAWLDQGERSGVHLDATFEGSKADCSFKLFECTEGKRPSLISRIRRFLGLQDDRSPWHERAHWKAEIKDVETVEVAILESTLVWDAARRPVAEDRLRTHLSRLAERWTSVDHSY